MSPNERMLLCRIIEKMNDNEDYSRKLGLENASRFHGNTMEIRKEKRDD